MTPGPVRSAFAPRRRDTSVSVAPPRCARPMKHEVLRDAMTADGPEPLLVLIALRHACNERWQSRGRVCAGARMRRSSLRADSPAVLGLVARRETRYAHCVRCARTIATSQMNVARCARGHEPWPCRARRAMWPGRSQGTSRPPDGLCACSPPRRRICRCRRTPTPGFAGTTDVRQRHAPVVLQGCGRAGWGAHGRRRAAQRTKGHRDAPKRGATASMSSCEHRRDAQRRAGHARAERGRRPVHCGLVFASRGAGACRRQRGLQGRGGAALGARAAQGTLARRAKAPAGARPGLPARGLARWRCEGPLCGSDSAPTSGRMLNDAFHASRVARSAMDRRHDRPKAWGGPAPD
jgi:hypothetical protein